MHPPSLTPLAASSATGSRLARATRSTAVFCTRCRADTPWVPCFSELRLLRALLTLQPCPNAPGAAAAAGACTTPVAGRGATRARCAARLDTVLRFTGGTSPRCALAGLTQASCASSAWCTAVRHASTGRRPTFIEISEALDALGVAIEEDAKVVKKKYRELVKKNHPDAGGDEAIMARVTVAYERLSSLTKREKEEYKMQKKVFHSGGGGSGSGSGSRRYRPGPPGGYGYAAPSGPFNARAANMYGQYYQQDANTAYQQSHNAGQQSYWNQFHKGAGFSENPFNGSNPFSMHAQAQRARFVPTGTLLVQGLVVYLVFSAIFLYLYRRYRDWGHDDGWRMSESLARHEQMQEMHRIRQEMNERARAMLLRDGSDGGNGELPGLFPGANGLYGNRQYVGESPEARALEYARQRRIQMMQEQQEAAANAPELRGWPKIDEEKGRIIKRAQDPPGIVFFEPRREDMRRRQIDNQRRASGFTRRTEAPPAAPAASQEGTAPAAAAPAPEAAAAPAGGNASHPRLPPETNVSSIVMKPVSSEQEAQSVMRGLFSGLRRNDS